MDQHPTTIGALFTSLLEDVQAQWDGKSTDAAAADQKHTPGSSEEVVSRLGAATAVADHVIRNKLVNLHFGHLMVLEAACAGDASVGFPIAEQSAWRSQVFDRLYSYLLIELCDDMSCESAAAVLYRFVTDAALGAAASQQLFSHVPGKGVLLHRVLHLIYQQPDAEKTRQVLGSFLTQIAHASPSLAPTLSTVLGDFARDQPSVTTDAVFAALTADITKLAAAASS